MTVNEYLGQQNARVQTHLSRTNGGSRVVEHTPNGREILQRADGRMEVQPCGDNYWIVVDTVEQARDAYSHPEMYQS